MFWYRGVVFCGLVFLPLIACVAQTALRSKIDRYVTTEMRRQKIPGISLAVLRGGKIVVLKSYGLANVEHRVPVRAETVFQSGSIGKQFTAAAVMLLIEEGRLALDDKIAKYFTDAPASWKSITVRHLLANTSGLGDYPPEVDLRRDYTEEEYWAIVKKSSPAFEPGTKWDYSNAGYFTLGVLVRRVTGKFYGDFLRERIFNPLAMRTARIISEADIIPNRAAGYRLENGALKNQEWVSPSTNTTADGSLYFTILDLAKWDAALYTDRPLRQTTLAEMWTPAKLADGTQKAYGLGWHTEKIKGRRFVYHGGAWQGFKSFIGRFPDDRLTIIFFANSWDARELKLARGLAALFYPEFELPAEQPVEDKEPAVTNLVRRVLLGFSRDAADSNMFTRAAQTEIFPGKAKQFYEKLNSLSIPVAVIYTNELIERRAENNLRVYRYLLTDATRSFSCTVKLAPDDKIIDIQLEEIAVK